MKTKITLLIAVVQLLFCSALSTAQAQKVNARYCKTYADYVAGRWQSVDSLVAGRTKQMCQVKFEDDQFKFKTGDKEADAVIKRDVLVMEYAGHLYVNCHNLRCNDIPLDVSNYAQAYRYGGNKLCVVAHWINGGALLAGIAGDVATIAAPLPVAVPAFVGSEAIWWNMDKLNNYRCYLLGSDANAKGKTAVERITDEFMAKELANNKALLERYNAVKKKGARQSASNILPVLLEQGLIKE